MQIEISSVRFDLDEDWCRARLKNSGRCGDETHRSGDYFIARSNIKREQRHVQRGGATRDPKCMTLPQAARELRFKCRYRIARGQNFTLEHAGERLEFGVTEIVTKIGDFPV